MSYNNNQAPRRTAPLITRAQKAPGGAPPPSSHFSTGLGGAIAGALGGMGYGASQHPQAPYPPPPANEYGHPVPGHPHQLPYGGAGGGYPPAQGAYGAPLHYGQPLHFGQPQQPHHLPPPPPQSAYPSSFYPSSHPYQHQPPPLPYASTSSQLYYPPQNHYQQPQYPQTTPDGYTLSSSYVPPAELPPAPAFPSRGGGGGGTEGAGGGRGGKRARGGDRPPPQQQGPQIFSCKQDGCVFTGKRKDVREHEEDRHLIYEPGREPKPWSGSLKPLEGAVIEGTGVSLDTPEALARWIEERKKRWPSKKVVDEKEAARAQRVAAGLEAPPRGSRGRGRGRGDSSGRGDSGGRGGRGGGHGGFVAGAAYEQGAHGPPPEPSAEGEPAAKRVKGEDGTAITKGEGKKAAEGEDGSDSDGGSSSFSDQDSVEEEEEEEDDGPPEEASAKVEVPEGEGEGETKAEEGAAPELQKRFQVVCRHWRKGQCQLGDEHCPYLHHLPANALPPPAPKRKRPAPPSAPHNPFARPTSFSSDPFALLAERDHRHIVSDVLQVIEFLGANDWLRGVEIRRGQLDEESGIEVLAESETAPSKIEVVEESEVASAIKTKDEQTNETPVPNANPLANLTGFPLPTHTASSLSNLADEQAVAAYPASALPSSPVLSGGWNAPLLPIAANTSTHQPLAPSPLHSTPRTALPVPVKPVVKVLPPPELKKTATGLLMLADYGSDSEDDDEEAIAASLVRGV